MTDLKEEFALLIGRAVLDGWSELPRQTQATLFDRAVADHPLTRFCLAVYLHEHHPRTTAGQLRPC